MGLKGDTTVISRLNGVLGQELISINQAFLHARMLRNWGIEDLGKRLYDKSIADMKQADRLIERILLLEGLPNLQSLGRLRIGEAVPEILGSERALTLDAIAAARTGVADCETANDFVSRALLDRILREEEDRLDWIDTEIDLVGRMGLGNYIQLRS